MTLASLLLLALSLAQAKPIVPKGYDAEYPNTYYHVDYRQSPLNALLRRVECKYRVYRSGYDGSYIAVQKTPDRSFETLGWVDGDRDKGPALAFGSRRLSGEDRQKLTLTGALWVLELPQEEIYTSVFDPYKPIGRRDLETGALVFEDRDRATDLMSWLERGRPDVVDRVESFRAALADALHDDGGAFRRLEARQGKDGWRWTVRTDKTRADSDGPELHLLGSRDAQKP